MASGVDLENGSGKHNPYKSEYKKRSSKIDQETRRHFLLVEQKRRREESYDTFRDFSDVFTYSDDSNLDDIEENQESFTEQKRNDVSKEPKFPNLNNLFMFSEWMTELPDDFEDKWILMPCPVGRRCLVKSFKGSTSVYNKSGYQAARFRSALPNGGFHDHSMSKYSKSDITVLDCIWNGNVQKYFILDILYWKGQSYLDTDIGFRNFWITSKIEEMPFISEKSRNNPYPFVPLNSYPCDCISISSIMSKYPYFECDKPPIDGLLFYHKDGYYTPGVSPLVLWLKPFMLVEILGQDVHLAEEYIRTIPTNYANMFDYISNFEETRKQRAKRRHRRGKCAESVEEMELCEDEVEVDDLETEVLCSREHHTRLRDFSQTY